MAKQSKKSTARKAPHAAEPRMYGDGQPSQPTDAQHVAPAEPVKQTSAHGQAAPAGRTPTTRTAGVTPRGAGAAGAYARVDKIVDYTYVKQDLRRLGITAAGILAVLVVLGIFIR